MNVEVRLFATLRRHLPPGGGRTAVRLDLAAGASVADALTHLGISDGSPLIILLDGRYDIHTRFTYTFASPDYINSNRRSEFEKECRDNPDLRRVSRCPAPGPMTGGAKTELQSPCT